MMPGSPPSGVRPGGPGSLSRSPGKARAGVGEFPCRPSGDSCRRAGPYGRELELQRSDDLSHAGIKLDRGRGLEFRQLPGMTYASASWQYVRNRTTMAITGRWEKDVYPGLRELEVTLPSVDFRIERREKLTRALFTAQLLGSYRKTNYPHAALAPQIIGSTDYANGILGAALAWRHGRGLEVRLRCDHDSYSASNGNTGYRETRAFLTVGYRPALVSEDLLDRSVESTVSRLDGLTGIGRHRHRILRWNAGVGEVPNYARKGCRLANPQFKKYRQQQKEVIRESGVPGIASTVAGGFLVRRYIATRVRLLASMAGHAFRLR